MLNSLLNWIGIERNEPSVKGDFTVDDALLLIARNVADMQDRSLDSSAVRKIFVEMSRIEGIDNYLRDTLNNDISRYFAATNDAERELVRGAFSRTSYIWGKLKSVRLDK